MEQAIDFVYRSLNGVRQTKAYLITNVTVAGSLVAPPALTVYVNESVPVNPAAGV